MSEEKKEGAAEGAEGEAKPKSKKKLIIILAVVLLLGGGGGAFFMLKGGTPPPEGEDAEHHEEEAKPHLQTAELDTFIVNLSENSSFLKVKILIEYDLTIIEKASGHGEGGDAKGEGHAGGGEGEKPGGMPPLLKEREPMIRDSVIRVLSSKKVSDVLTPQGKEQLKEELIEAINAASGMEEGAVVNIYFTEFIIQ